MEAESINKIRIKLLVECFGISALGLLINLVFAINVFLFVPSRLFHLALLTICIMTTTAIAQIVGNEIWLMPIRIWLLSHPSFKREVLEERSFFSALKLTLLFLIFFVVTLALAIGIVRHFSIFSWEQTLMAILVVAGTTLFFLLSWLLLQRWQAIKLAKSKTQAPSPFLVANAFLKFPSKSAGLSLFLWFYAGIGLALGFYYIAGFSRFESFYILIIAWSTGILAFPFQYLLFKRTLQSLLQIFLTEHPRLLEQKGLFQISLRYKLFTYFFSLGFFTVCFSFTVNYSRTIEILKNQSARLFEAELSAEMEELFKNPVAPESLREILAGRETKTRRYFLISKTGQVWFGEPGAQLSAEQIKEMLGKEKGAFPKLRTDSVVVFAPVSGTDLILGRIHSWEEIKREIETVRVLTLCFIGLIVLISIVFSFLASSEIFSPMKALVSETKFVGERNFTDRPLPLSDDEMNQLAKSFFEMRLSIRNYVEHSDQLISKIENTVSELDSTTQLLVQIAKEQSEGSAHQASSLEEAYQILEKLSESARRLKEKSYEIEKSVSQTSNSYNLGVSILKNAIKAVHAGQEQVNRIQQVMAILEGHSKRIEKIVSIIEEIATQNNLLALNALVEASVAGEAGERFSVVAEEMKRLAGMTRQFNTNIGAIIKDMLDSVSEITKATYEGGELMDKSAQLVSEAGEAFTGFSSLIDLSVNTSEEIVSSMTLQIKTNEEITKALSEIKLVAHQLANRTTEIEKSMLKLANLGEELKILISQRRV